MIFKKMIGVHRYIGVKNNSKTLVTPIFQNFEPLLANWALKFKKSAKRPKQLFLTKILIRVSKQRRILR
jgi:hypothetical protein